MEFGGQAVPDRNAGIAAEVFHDLLVEAAVFDTVKHAAENLRGVFERLFLTHLGGTRIKVGHPHSEVVAGHFEGAAGTGRCLLEQQNDVLAGEVLVRSSRPLETLEVSGEFQQILNLFRGEVQQLQKISS